MIRPAPRRTTTTTTRPQIDQDCDFPAAKPGPKGDTGDRGPAGPPGKDGKDGQVTDEQIAVIVAAVVAQLERSEKVRGPAGPPGPPATVDVDAIVQQVIENMPPFKVTRIYIDEAGEKHIVATGTVTVGGEMTLYDGPGSEQQHREMLGLE